MRGHTAISTSPLPIPPPTHLEVTPTVFSAAAQLVGHVHNLARAGATDRVAERDAAAPDIGPISGEIRKVVEGGGENRGKSLVDLEEIDVADGSPALSTSGGSTLNAPSPMYSLATPTLCKGPAVRREVPVRARRRVRRSRARPRPRRR